MRMPDVSGVEMLAAARQHDPDVPVILMTAQATLQSAMQAVNEGAFYYIQKPFRNDELLAILRRAAEHRELRVENKSLKQEIRRARAARRVASRRQQRSWLEVLRLAETVAPTDSTVLIQGESGTGKEVIARYIHELSTRTDGPFLSINCGALPESLLESELFGHVKGSFTGAVKDKSRPVRRGGEGHVLPRRDRRDDAGHAGEAAARAAAPRSDSRRRDRAAADRHAPRRRHEPRARGGDSRAATSAATCTTASTSSRCTCRRCASAATTSRCSPTHFLAAHRRPAQRGAAKRAQPDALDALHELHLARQRARAGERARARGDPHAGRRDRRSRRCRSASRSARAEPLVAERPPPNPTLEAVERAYIMWVLQSESGNKRRAAEVLGIDPSTLYRKLSRYGVEA